MPYASSGGVGATVVSAEIVDDSIVNADINSAAAIAHSKLANVSATDKLLGRATAGAGAIEEIALTAAGRALIDDASAAVQATTLGLGTGDSPQLTAINLGHASDTTLTRTGAGDVAIEGNAVYRAGGTDVPITDGGTGASVAATAIANLGGLALAGGTMTGDITLAENTSVVLDPAGSDDGKYSGITVTATGGTTIAFGDLLYLAVADSRWELVDADALATSGMMLGMAVTASTDGGALTVLLLGIIRADANFPALTIGSPVYAGETPGDIQVAVPTETDGVIRVVGYALTADEIFFNPSPDHITIT